MRTTAHHSRIASASVLRQASSALSAGNCSVAKADLEAVDIVRLSNYSPCSNLASASTSDGAISSSGAIPGASNSHNHCKISLSVFPRRQIGDHGSGWPHAALLTQNPAQLTLHGHRAALPGGCTS
ncbi:hypothetical protein T09_10306 [Trichinella sp. T9]|nr:hypothetical protein T09_10306 [Trichinella sp. T9]